MPPTDLCRARQSINEGGFKCSMAIAQVCNVHTDQLDYLKQHLRGRQHMRRLHNPPSERKE